MDKGKVNPETVATEEFEKSQDSGVRDEIKRELNLLPPLMPLKFGNGLLLQYTVNMPGQDDKLYFLEIGLVVGLTSLALVLVNTLVSYLILSAPSLLGLSNPVRLARLAWLAKIVNRAVGLVQVGLLVFLFIYSVTHWGSVDFINAESEFFVKKRIFMFSLIVSTTMFVCSVVGGVVVVVLWCHHPAPPSSKSMDISPTTIPPAASFLPLGLANALLGLYIGIPGDDQTVVGPKVFLLDLCLYIGTITIMLTVMQSILRLALLVALRDGRLDPGEGSVVRLLHLSRYLMAGTQFVMFSLMLGHSGTVLAAVEGDKDYVCPRNLLVICLVLSGVLVGAGTTALALLAFLAF